jgi:hypothetical protein
MLNTKQLSIASLVLMSFSCVAEVSMNVAVTSKLFVARCDTNRG